MNPTLLSVNTCTVNLLPTRVVIFASLCLSFPVYEPSSRMLITVIFFSSFLLNLHRISQNPDRAGMSNLSVVLLSRPRTGTHRILLPNPLSRNAYPAPPSRSQRLSWTLSLSQILVSNIAALPRPCLNLKGDYTVLTDIYLQRNPLPARSSPPPLRIECRLARP